MAIINRPLFDAYIRAHFCVVIAANPMQRCVDVLEQSITTNGKEPDLCIVIVNKKLQVTFMDQAINPRNAQGLGGYHHL